MSGKRKSFVSNVLMLVLAVVIAAGVVNASAGADLRTPPVSQTLKNLPFDDVPIHEVAAIDRNALLAEDDSGARKGPAPLRFSTIAEVKKTPQDDGVWQDLPGVDVCGASGCRLPTLRTSTSVFRASGSRPGR